MCPDVGTYRVPYLAENGNITYANDGAFPDELKFEQQYQH